MILTNLTASLFLLGALAAIKPTDRECSQGQECILRSECPSYQESLAAFSQLTKGNYQYSSTLENLQNLICNQEKKGVCCPCPKERCVSYTTCQSLKKEVQDITGGDDRKKNKAVKKLKSLICNQTDKKVCCPSSLSTHPPFANLTDLPDPSALPRVGQCGKLQSRRGKFIVGGENTDIGEFPFAALLGFSRQKSKWKLGRTRFYTEDIWFCGGVLINRWYILTASHCHVGGTSNAFITRARLGEWTVGLEEQNFPKHQDFNIRAEDIKKHDEFKHVPKKNIFNDIALVKLPRMAQLNQGVQPVCLPAFPDDYQQFFQTADFEASTQGQEGTVVGWGFTKYNPFEFNELQQTTGSRTPSNKQQKLKVSILSNQQCRKRFSSFSPVSSQVCAGGEIGKDSCKGDSGGGLFQRRSEETPWYLLGLVSLGSPFCGNGSPAIFTRVYSFLPWLQENMK